MRKKFLTLIIDKIKKNNEYNNTEILEIKYGLEIVYVIITRTVIFLLINILLGTFIEFIIFYIIYAIIRSFSFGLHAKSSVACFFVSSIAFIGIPYISSVISFNIVLKILLSIYFYIIFLIFSPADTPKKPLVNKYKRKKLKYYSLITVTFYIIGLFTLNDLISNIIILVLIYQSILISPLLYKILNINYNNYLNYKFE